MGFASPRRAAGDTAEHSAAGDTAEHQPADDRADEHDCAVDDRAALPVGQVHAADDAAAVSRDDDRADHRNHGGRIADNGVGWPRGNQYVGSADNGCSCAGSANHGGTGCSTNGAG